MHVDVNGTRLWVTRDGSGPSVLLVHGLSDTHELWRHQVPSLRTRYDTVTVDMPGHGRSELPPGVLSMGLIASTMWSLLDKLDIDSLYLVGLSMGGGVVQNMTFQQPERVRALVLVSTSSEFTPDTRERFLRRARVAEQEGMAAVISETVPRWFTPGFMASHPDTVEATERTVLANPPSNFAAASRANAKRDWTAQLDTIRCPVLFVGGAKDPADAIAGADLYRAHVPNVEIHVLDDVSHLLPVEAPDAFNDLLLEFLDRMSGRPAESGPLVTT